MKRATLLLAAALIAALSLTSCAHLGISTPQPNQEVPWKDETAAAFGEITGESVTSAVTDGGIGVVTRRFKGARAGGGPLPRHEGGRRRVRLLPDHRREPGGPSSPTGPPTGA